MARRYLVIKVDAGPAMEAARELVAEIAARGGVAALSRHLRDRIAGLCQGLAATEVEGLVGYPSAELLAVLASVRALPCQLAEKK
jgi:hypothetical protein